MHALKYAFVSRVLSRELPYYKCLILNEILRESEVYISMVVIRRLKTEDQRITKRSGTRIYGACLAANIFVKLFFSAEILFHVRKI